MDIARASCHRLRMRHHTTSAVVFPCGRNTFLLLMTASGSLLQRQRGWRAIVRCCAGTRTHQTSFSSLARRTTRGSWPAGTVPISVPRRACAPQSSGSRRSRKRPAGSQRRSSASTSQTVSYCRSLLWCLPFCSAQSTAGVQALHWQGPVCLNPLNPSIVSAMQQAWCSAANAIEQSRRSHQLFCLGGLQAALWVLSLPFRCLSTPARLTVSHSHDISACLCLLRENTLASTNVVGKDVAGVSSQERQA